MSSSGPFLILSVKKEICNMGFKKSKNESRYKTFDCQFTSHMDLSVLVFHSCHSALYLCCRLTLSAVNHGPSVGVSAAATHTETLLKQPAFADSTLLIILPREAFMCSIRCALRYYSVQRSVCWQRR